MVQMPFDRRNNSYLGKWLNHKQNWTTKVFCWIVDCISVQGMQQVKAFQLQLRFCFLFKDYHHKSIIYNIQCKNASHSHPHPLPKDESWNLQLKTNAFTTRTSDRFRHLCRAINQAQVPSLFSLLLIVLLQTNNAEIWQWLFANAVEIWVGSRTINL